MIAAKWLEINKNQVKKEEVNKEIIVKHENGVRVSDLASQFGIAKFIDHEYILPVSW